MAARIGLLAPRSTNEREQATLAGETIRLPPAPALPWSAIWRIKFSPSRNCATERSSRPGFLASALPSGWRISASVAPLTRPNAALAAAFSSNLRSTDIRLMITPWQRVGLDARGTEHPCHHKRSPRDVTQITKPGLGPMPYPLRKA